MFDQLHPGFAYAMRVMHATHDLQYKHHKVPFVRFGSSLEDVP